MRVWLRRIRFDKAYSEAKVAEMAKITQPFYHNVEVGKKNPSVETAKKIASVLDFPWTKFFEDSKKEGEPA